MSSCSPKGRSPELRAGSRSRNSTRPLCWNGLATERGSSRRFVRTSRCSSARLAPSRLCPAFCTVYRSDSELRGFLSERREPLQAALERVRGRVELGVKAFVDRERFVEGQAPRNDKIRELRERAASLAEGRASLERRRLEHFVSSEVERLRSTAGSDIHARLLVPAGDGLPLALQPPDVSGREEEMIFHGAYLVGADERKFEAVLGSLAAEYRDAGVEFELTGPWPPYNFVPEELQAS